MSKIVYVGNKAGLHPLALAKKERWGGDMNSVHDYVVVCKCERELGVLSRFTPNPAGQRTPCCMICKHITVIEKNGQISDVVLLTQEKLDIIIRNMKPAQGSA